jgi:glyoxylase-like metal-dependent hydrolase (beta-lactamase superfamily II)
VERAPSGVTLVRADNPGPFTLTGTNTYLLGEPAWVIDPGPADPDHIAHVLKAAEAHGGIAGVALTHRHADHAAGLPLLLEHVTVEVVAGPQPDEAESIGEPSAAVHPDRILADGAHAGPFRVFWTPGHTADHISLLAGRVLFCGDTVLGEGSVFIPPGGGSMGLYLESLRRLRELDLEALCPGHGPVVWEARAKLDEYISHRLERERRLVEALGRGIRTTDGLLDEVWDDAPPVLRPAAALTLEAHLDKLEREGLLPAGVERLDL